MSNKRSNSFRRAILQGSRQLRGCSLRDEVGLGLSQRLVRHVAYETLPREVDRKWYFDSYTYCPPPWLILTITIAEVRQAVMLKCLRRSLLMMLSRVSLLLSQVVVFMYYGFQLDRLVLQVSSPSFLKSPLPYHPQLRAQAWRYLSYIFMHTGWVKILDFQEFLEGRVLGIQLTVFMTENISLKTVSYQCWMVSETGRNVRTTGKILYVQATQHNSCCEIFKTWLLRIWNFD